MQYSWSKKELKKNAEEKKNEGGRKRERGQLTELPRTKGKREEGRKEGREWGEMWDSGEREMDKGEKRMGEKEARERSEWVGKERQEKGEMHNLCLCDCRNILESWNDLKENVMKEKLKR